MRAGLVLLVFTVVGMQRSLLGQQDTVHAIPKRDTLYQITSKKKPFYYRQEEIIYEAKRYRVYHNYLTAGPLMANSDIRTSSQRGVGIDFNWHIRRQYFQTGVLMSGVGFGDNNHVSGHITYGPRLEKENFAVGVFLGPAYTYGVEGQAGTQPVYYNQFGGYLDVQLITKFAYDMGLGLELFSEITAHQKLFGFKIIAFFSGAYRGPKRNYNPNVRAENPKWQK